MKTHKHNYAKISPPPPSLLPVHNHQLSQQILLRLSRWSMIIYVHEVIIISMIVLILPTYHIAHLAICKLFLSAG